MADVWPRCSKRAALARLSRPRDLLEMISRYGDRAMDFVWKHKGSLAVTAVLAAFLADPEPFLNGAKDLAKVVGEKAIRPVAEVPGRVAEIAARQVNWTAVIFVVLLLTTGIAVLRSRLRKCSLRWPTNTSCPKPVTKDCVRQRSKAPCVENGQSDTLSVVATGGTTPMWL